MKTANNVHPILQPDFDAILQHLEMLFGRASDGMVEIAWTDGNTKRLQHAELFDVGDLDMAAEKAFEQNAREFQNVYVGAALRKPGTFPGARAKDDDFMAAWSFHADLDDEGAPDRAKAVYSEKGLMPPVAVTTGRKPHKRAQLWFPVEDPITDPEAYRAQLQALADALGGDTTVTNPSRVMRLGGTVAWPIKAGRVAEKTELHVFTDRRQTFFAEEMARAFSKVQPSPTALNLNTHDTLDTEALAKQIAAGHQWHDNMIRLVGHWVSRGWSDHEIHLAAQSFTLSGYTDEDTAREVQQAIDGARKKWAVPDTHHAVEEEISDLKAEALGNFDFASIPPREWILGNRLIRKFVSVTIAPGGLGKSTLTLEEALSIATGKPITGDLVHMQGNVWIYNNEDPLEELHRRIAAICINWDIPVDSVAHSVFVNSGVSRRLMVAKRMAIGIVQTPDVEPLIAELRKNEIVALTVDPFVRVHNLSENANDEIDFVASQFSRIAQEADCAISLVHHTRKMPAGAQNSYAGNMDAGRGASALSNAVRVAHTLMAMSEKDAEGLNIAAENKWQYVRLDDAKGNMSPPAQRARWFQRKGVILPNDDDSLGLDPDEVGVLEVWTPDDADWSITVHDARQVLEEAQRRWAEKRPFSASPQSPRYLGSYMMTELGINKAHAKSIVGDWLTNGVIASQVYDPRNKTRGVEVLFFPGN
jgi:RecA-family ATPase